MPHRLNQRRQRFIEVLEPSPIQAQSRHAKPLGDSVYLGTRLTGLRHANRVIVILDHKKHRQFLTRSPVQSFEEFTFASGTLSGRDIYHLVAAVRFDGTGHPHGIQILCAGYRRWSHQPQFAGRPLLRHVAAVGVRIALAAQHAEEDVLDGHAQTYRNRFGSVIREEPVVTRLQQHSHADLEFLVAARRRLETALALSHKYLHPLFDVEHGQHLAIEF